MPKDKVKCKQTLRGVGALEKRVFEKQAPQARDSLEGARGERSRGRPGL